MPAPPTLPDTMRAIAIAQPGGPDVLHTVTVPVPTPKPGEVLIRVTHAGVNRPDVLQRAGSYAPPPEASPLPGLEVAGTIVALGQGTGRYALGDRVCALTPGGGYAEYCTAPERHCLPPPDGFDNARAAALPETSFTVLHNMIERGGLTAGEWLLVHGGSSGIGTIAIQMAKAIGARVITTVGNAEKAQACRALGADEVVLYRDMDFVAAAKAATQGQGVDLVLDMVGGSYVERNLDALAMDGRHVSIAFLGGARMELTLAKVMMKRLTLTGSTLRPQSIEAKARMAARLEREIWPMIAQGRIRPIIHRVLPLGQAAEAHALMESSTHIGKILLAVANPLADEVGS